MLRNISKVTFDLITKSIPKTKDRIIDNIFACDRAFTTSYSLKPEIDNISTLRKTLEGIIDDGHLTDLINYFKSNEIDLQIPIELKRLIQNDPGDVAFFVGAGASKLLEYPTWNELANKAIEELEKKRYISSYEKEIFQKEIKDPKIKLSLFETRLSSTEAFQFYKDNLKKRSDQSSQKNIYKILVSDVFTSCIKLTTNVDSEFVNALIENKSLSQIPERENIIISNNEHLSITPNDNRLETELTSEAIYYLHGFIEKESDDLIFSTTNYLKHYFQEGTKKTSLKKFLEILFGKCTVIFLGSSLEELQILEVIRSTTKPHYALMPTYFENLQFLELKAQYLKNLNLTILPYFLDNDGYSRLYSVLDAWKNELQTPSPKGVDYAKLIKDNIENGEKVEEILKLIREKPENYIYLLLQPIDAINWFCNLKSNGLLNSSYFQENTELLYQKISFLRRVIQKALEEKDKGIIKDLADLIKDDFLHNKIHLNDTQLYFRLIDIIKDFPITEIDNRLIDLLINEASFDSSVPLLPEKYSLFNKLFPSLVNAKETDLAFYLLEKYYYQNIINISHNGEKYDLGIYSKVTESTSFQEFAQSITQDKLITLSKLFSLSNLVKYKAFLMTIQSDSCNAGLTVISASKIQIKVYDIPSESQSKPETIFEDILEILIFEHTEDEILEKINDKVMILPQNRTMS
ncbi:MAG: SIR2 family protein [Prolixibacteraceae bacterium]